MGIPYDTCKYLQPGVRICQHGDPTVHAKFLAWDDDHVLVTSYNMLSADPSEDLHTLRLLEYVEQRDQAFSVRPRILRLADAYLSNRTARVHDPKVHSATRPACRCGMFPKVIGFTRVP